MPADGRYGRLELALWHTLHLLPSLRATTWLFTICPSVLNCSNGSGVTPSVSAVITVSQRRHGVEAEPLSFVNGSKEPDWTVRSVSIRML